MVDLIAPRLITDAGVSARCFSTAFFSCWYNVKINANDLKDPERSESLKVLKAGMGGKVKAHAKKVLDRVAVVLGD